MTAAMSAIVYDVATDMATANSAVWYIKFDYCLLANMFTRHGRLSLIKL